MSVRAMTPRWFTPLLASALLVGCSDTIAVGPRLLVTSGFTDEVVLLDPSDGRIERHIAVDPRPGERDEPYGVAASADGAHWYVTVAQGDPTLWKFESDGDRRVGRVALQLPGAGRPGLSPDGRRAVVPDYWLGGTGAGSGAAVVRLDDLTVTERITLCPAPHQAEFSPDGRWIAVPCPLSDELLLLDGVTYDVRHRVTLPEQPGGPFVTRAGNPRTRPMNVVWAPASDRVYVTLMRQGSVAAIDTSGVELARAATPRGATQIAITPDGAQLVIPAREDFAVAILDAATLATRAVVTTPDSPHPHGVVLSPDGVVAYVTHEGTTRSSGGVTAIRLADGAILWRTEVGVFTLGIAWRP